MSGQSAYDWGWDEADVRPCTHARQLFGVGSTGGGNTCLETLCGGLIFERFPWPFVELPCNGTQLGLAV